MRRVLLGTMAVVGLILGASLPVSASFETPITIDCSDGDSLALTVDVDTLSALTESVNALNAADTGVSCTLVQAANPVPVVTFGGVAAAASGGGYVIGGGTVHVACPGDSSHVFTGSFSVKMYNNGGVRGSATLKVPTGQCVAPSTLTSRPTCLVIIPTTVGGGRAWANTFVTRTTGAYFAPNLGKTIGWAFEDNGPHGGTLTKDRWRVEEKPGSCPVPGDPTLDYYTLLTGDVTVRP
jgi:hypothetical protein